MKCQNVVAEFLIIDPACMRMDESQVPEEGPKHLIATTPNPLDNDELSALKGEPAPNAPYQSLYAQRAHH